jgi:hypothetical protein
MLKAVAIATDLRGMARHSVSFYICAAFLAIFGVLGLNAYDPGPAKVELLLAVVVLAAGLYLHSGAEQARTVGMVVLAGVIAYGAWQLTQGAYVPGTIVAGFALVRLATAGSSTAAPQVGLQQAYQPGYQPQQPYGYAPGAPQQMYYGQQPLGQPAPYGAPPAAPYGAPQPYPAPPPPQTVGDPRFGAPVPPPQPQRPPQPPQSQQAYDPYAPPPGS